MAGASAAFALRQSGFQGRVLLLGAESLAPYERPPLSKDYLLGQVSEQKLFLRPAADYTAHGIELRLGMRAVGLDASAREVVLDGPNPRVAFDQLLIATGGEPRRLSVPGADLPGIFYLRRLGDADALRGRIASQPGTRVVVVGAGFIGAEVAAACRTMEFDVTLVEPLAVPMERVLGRELGAMLAEVHREHGVDLRLGEGVAAFRGSKQVEA